MEKKEVSAGEHIAVGQVTIVPIVRTSAHCRRGGRGLVGSGSKEVLGVVVLSPEGQYAISVSGEEVPLKHFAEQVPEVERLLTEDG